MKRKVISAALVVMMAVSLIIGCSSKSDSSDKADSGGKKEAASYEWEQVGSVENAKLVEQEPKKELKFAFLGYSNNSYWDLIYEGVDQATKFLAGHKVTIEKINLGTAIGADVMNQALETCMLGGYDGIICTTFVSGCENYINKCVEAGIPVGIIGGEGGESKRAFCIAGDAFETSTVAADMIDKKLGGNKGKFGVIVAQFSMEVTEKARKNAIGILEDKGYECVGSFEAHDSADEVYAVTEQLMTAHDDLAAIYCVSGGTYGMPAAVADAKKGGDIYLVGNDEIAENLEYVRQGVMDVIGQNPSGYAFDAFTYLYNIVVADQYPEKDTMAAAAPVITKENVDELYPE